MSAIGLVVQFSSELCEALRLCLAQLLMCNMSLHQFEVLRLMSSACVAFLCVGIWLLEWRSFVDERAWERVLAHPHWYLSAGGTRLVRVHSASSSSVSKSSQRSDCSAPLCNPWAAAAILA